MEDESTTAATDNSQGTENQNSATDSQTAANTTSNDNLDTSKTDDTSAADDKSKSTTTDDDAAASSAKKFDTDLDEWAEKTNRAKPTTDRERELYQEIRDGQREFSRSKQAKDSNTELNKALESNKPADNKTDDEDERDPLEVRLDELEAERREERSLRMRSEYFTEQSVTNEQAKVMGEILKEKVDRAATPQAKKAAYDFWTDPANLSDWHALAKARLSTTADTSVAEQEAARKERERIAKESQAAGTNRSATTVTTSAPKGYDRAAYLKSDD